MKPSTFRALVILIGLTLALSLFSTSSAQRKPKSQTHQPPAAGGPCALPEPPDAKTALKDLEAGNKRWQKLEMKERNWGEERERTARCGQRPSAVVLACMDSRVPPELIFDRGLGELFVIRVAGPVLGPDQLASLYYAVNKIHVNLVVVLGHTDCGAVEGAVAKATGTYLTELLRKIEPAIDDVSEKYNRGVRIKLSDPKTPDEQKNLDRVSFVNADLVQTDIRSRPAFRKPGVEVKWALYYLKSGKVAFDPTELEP